MNKITRRQAIVGLAALGTVSTVVASPRLPNALKELDRSVPTDRPIRLPRVTLKPWNSAIYPHTDYKIVANGQELLKDVPFRHEMGQGLWHRSLSVWLHPDDSIHFISFRGNSEPGWGEVILTEYVYPRGHVMFFLEATEATTFTRARLLVNETNDKELVQEELDALNRQLKSESHEAQVDPSPSRNPQETRGRKTRLPRASRR